MIRMATVYTGRGDEGDTDLFSGERVPKTNKRIEAYGSVDELNSVIGVATSFLENQHDDLEQELEAVQNHLHVICANLANTEEDTDRPSIGADDVEWMEDVIDRLEDDLPDLTSFILPGGVRAASHLHHGRSVCRRAERRVLKALESDDGIEELNLKYLNRLSDLLFTLARTVNHRHNHPEKTPDY
jgi:cob(I)alamin adenosyltransferase